MGLRLLYAGFSVREKKKDLPQLRPKPWHSSKLKVWWSKDCSDVVDYPLSYRVPVRERYGSTLLPATREQHDQNCTQSH